MKTLNLLVAILLLVALNDACSAQSEKENKPEQISHAEKVHVYYFHYTRRCATCNAVEDVSQKAVSELYGNQVSFSGYNLDEKKGAEIGKELEVSGQTLLIVSGETKIDITNEGFFNARSNPDKLKAIIKEKIDPLL